MGKLRLGGVASCLTEGQSAGKSQGSHFSAILTPRSRPSRGAAAQSFQSGLRVIYSHLRTATSPSMQVAATVSMTHETGIRFPAALSAAKL